MRNNWLFIVVLLLVAACGNEEPKVKMPSAKEIEEMNKQFVQGEGQAIDTFIKEQKWEAVKTGTGLRYYVYEHGTGDSAKSDMRATVKMIVTLLNGDTCYSWKKYGTESFFIDHDHNESGLHEALKHMRAGDKAKVILPSYMAFGVAGDSDKIPRQSTVVYDIELVSLD